MTVFLQPIYTQTVGSGGASSITFNNIPQGFADLKLEISARTAGAVTNTDWVMSFNNDGASVYSSTQTGTYTQRQSNNAYILGGNFPGASATANTFGSACVTILNYSTFNYKSILIDSVSENLSTTAYALQKQADLYRSGSPITSITFNSAGGGNFAQYTTATLYGVLRTGSYPKAIGGQVSTDGTYWYHAFKNIGTAYFNPTQQLTCDILTIAGGGSGGSGYGAGAGAGGIVYLSSQLLTPFNNYQITVGAGGTPAITPNTAGNNGGNSQFSSLATAIGGGGGGSTVSAGKNGGSGGGGGGGAIDFRNAFGTGTSGQGNNGGSGTSAGGGGGGGAGGNAPANSGNYGGNGGAATSAYSSWGLATNTGLNVSGTVYYGAGGVGNGTAGSGTPSTGSAAYGSVQPTNSGNGAHGDYVSSQYVGGSGVVIVRYSV